MANFLKNRQWLVALTGIFSIVILFVAFIAYYARPPNLEVTMESSSIVITNHGPVRVILAKGELVIDDSSGRKKIGAKGSPGPSAHVILPNQSLTYVVADLELSPPARYKIDYYWTITDIRFVHSVLKTLRVIHVRSETLSGEIPIDSATP